MLLLLGPITNLGYSEKGTEYSRLIISVSAFRSDFMLTHRLANKISSVRRRYIL